MEVPELSFFFTHCFLFLKMKNQKSNDHVECSQTKFQHTNIKSQCLSVQGRHNVAHVRWSYDESRKSHYRQVLCHTYSTYIKTRSQTNRDKKTNQKGINNQKSLKLYKKNKNFSQNFVQKDI